MGRVVLNDPPLDSAPPAAGVQAETLVGRMLGALGAATDGAGRVDYTRLRGSDAFRRRSRRRAGWRASGSTR